MAKQDRCVHVFRSFAVALGIGILSSSCASFDAGPAVAPDPDRACNGLSAEVRRQSVLSGEIVRVSKKSERVGKQRRIVPRGVDISIAAEPDTNSAYLERRAHCEIAQNRALGVDSPTFVDGGPLMVDGVEVDVSRKGPNYVLELRSTSSASAREIQERAGALGPSS